MNAVANMVSKLALDTMLRTGVSAARTFLHKTVVDIVRAYRNSTSAAPTAFPSITPQAAPSGVVLPDELKLLPLLVLALQVGRPWVATAGVAAVVHGVACACMGPGPLGMIRWTWLFSGCSVFPLLWGVVVVDDVGACCVWAWSLG